MHHYGVFDYVKRIVPETSASFVVPAPPPFPLAGAAVDLWFAESMYYAGGTVAVTDELSISRASIGYAKTSSGTLTQFAADTLRITDLGLLVEDARINYLTRSEDFTHTDWASLSSGVSVTSDQAVAPNGTTTMDSIVDTAVTDRHVVYNYQSLPGSGLTVSLSFFFKDVDRRYVQVIGSTSQTDFAYCYADLQSGTITDSGQGGTALTYISSSIESFNNDIYRVTLIFTNSVNIIYAGFALSDRATHSGNIGAGSPVYLGDGKGVYAWGAQIEVGTFPSSYIPTTTTSAARAADVITIIGNAQTDIASSTGSIIAWTNRGESTGFAANVVDSNGTNLLGFNASNNAIASLVATLTTGNTANRTSLDKLGLAWDGSGRSLVLNAGTVATDASAQTPSSTQHLGSDGSANFIYAYCERLVVWTSKISDATLQGHTSP